MKHIVKISVIYIGRIKISIVKVNLISEKLMYVRYFINVTNNS